MTLGWVGCGLYRPKYDGSLPNYRNPKLFSAVASRVWSREESMWRLAMAPDKGGVVVWKSSRQYIRWIVGLTLLGTMLGGGWVACGAADDSGDDRLSRLDRRETREARAERDDRRTAAAESPGYQRERTGSFFQRLSSGGPTRPSLRGFNGRDDHGTILMGQRRFPRGDRNQVTWRRKGIATYSRSVRIGVLVM